MKSCEHWRREDRMVCARTRKSFARVLKGKFVGWLTRVHKGARQGPKGRSVRGLVPRHKGTR